MYFLKRASTGIRRSALVLLLPCLLLLAGTQSFAQQAAPARVADPAAWGIYARLVGTTWNGTGEGMGGLAQWQWASDDTIVEKRQYYKDQIISRGANPGELLAVYGSGIGTATYDGRIAADGSVLWIRRGLVKTPMRAAIVDGRYREELVKLDDAGQIVKVKSTGWYAQTSGQSANAPMVVAAPAAKAETANAAGLPAQPTVPAPVVTQPPPASFGAFERFIGKHLYAESDRSFLEFSRGPDNTLIVICHPLEGNSYWRYVVGESKKKPGRWELLDTPGGPKFAKGAEWKSDERLSIWAKDVSSPSWILNYEFHTTDDRVYLEVFKKQFNSLGLANGNTHNESAQYREISEATIAQMRVQMEESRRATARLKAQLPPPKSEAELYAERMAILAELAKDTNSYAAENYAEQFGLPYTPPEEDAPKPAAWFQALQNMSAEASASEARSRAALDATMQQAAQQAAYERQLAAEREQAAANARNAEDARRAREATERQYEIARQFEAQQQAQRLAQQQREQEAQRSAAVRPASAPPRPASAAGGNDGSAANCSAVYKSGVASSTYLRTQSEAERFARRDMELQCPGGSYTSDAMQCSQQSQGDVVNIDSKGHATKVGENTAWICKANFRCTAPSNQCKTGPGKGSAQ